MENTAFKKAPVKSVVQMDSLKDLPATPADGSAPRVKTGLKAGTPGPFPRAPRA